MKISQNKFLFIGVAMSAVIIFVAAYTIYLSQTGTSKLPQKRQANKTIQKNVNIPAEESPEEEKNFAFVLQKPVFAEYSSEEETVTPNFPDEKVEFSEMENIKNFTQDEKISFSDDQIKALEDSGFFLQKNNIIGDQQRGNDDFADMYDDFGGNNSKYYREPQDTVFVTSDVALHLYHILIDRSFQKIEEDKFQPMIRNITETLFKDSIENYNSATDAKIKDSYKRLSAYYLIPLVVLDKGSATSGKELKPEDFATYAQFLEAQEKQTKEASATKLEFGLSAKEYDGIKLSDEVYDLAKKELELINEANGLADSPIFTPLRTDFTNDYSQFKPRSHYTKNNILKSYFIAMMWYGRMGFTLNSPELTRDALIMTRQVNSLNAGDENLAKLWSDMSAVIEFFVGEVDDLTPYQYTEIIKEVYGNNALTNKEIVDDNLLENFINTAVEKLPRPKIVSEALSVYDNIDQRSELLKEIMQFRFMGQRFTPDAYILSSLTQGSGAPDSETGQKLPSTPTALMPISLFKPENKAVKKYLDEWVSENASDSDKVIAKFYNKLNQEFSAYDSSVWTQNIYWSWLNSFKALLTEYGQGYPYFMTNENWQKKNLGTSLGAYTELKHDTLLYAKQSYAELGGGGPSDNPELPPVPKGYVEPDLVFWNRITNLAEITRKGLEERDLFPQEFEHKYDTFIKDCEFFKQIIKQELQNQKIQDDDYEKLRTISKDFLKIVEALPGEDLTTKERRAGLIADIHTDAFKNQILYEATGKPYIIYVAVKDINGTRLTRGAVFNHYEFTDDLDIRLSDEDWQAKVYEGKDDLPKEDKWSGELVK